MVTVIIPAFNEEKTIRQVIKQAKRSARVSEIIVVDDQSFDNTVPEARKEGATVITSTSLGKGSSMREGTMIAKNDLLVFLDADIPNYATNIIDALVTPLINDSADFVKSYFDRQAGRVTEILVKPLLEYFFPHLLEFRQPLSGMIAGKRSFFQQVEFEDDYGVDIGLLIDMHHINARITEVCIGEIENDMQPLHALSRMAKQVSKAIFKRVNFFNVKPCAGDTLPPFTSAIGNLLKNPMPSNKKIVFFDMDNTLLRGSFIHKAAEEYNFKDELISIAGNEKCSHTRTKKIAGLLKGRTFGELIKTVEMIPIISDAVYVVRELQMRGYACGIISDSYQCVTNHIKNITGMDFAIGNELVFKNSIATGEVNIPFQFSKTNFSHCKHTHCKSNVILETLKHWGISRDNSIAVGDGENDVCMIKFAGKGVALNPTYSLLHEVSDYVFHTGSLKSVLTVAH